MLRFLLACGGAIVSTTALAGDTASVEEGKRVSIIGGCHDCHTDGYAESGGQIEASKALRGSVVGFQGPWGTTYPANLRATVSKMSEDDFVDYARNLKTRPPMPWFNVNHMTENELRSFYLYIGSLGEPGEPAPGYVEPGKEPTSPFFVFVPQMPAQ
jgi:hypothetical protein